MIAMAPGAHLTTPLVLICTGILLLFDLLLALLAWRFVRRKEMQQMRRLLIATSGVFFLLVWTSVMIWGWDWFYSYIFPGWARYLLPPLFGLGYTVFAMGMSWLCMKLPGNPAILWCLLGGLEGLLSHIYAIYGLGAASKPPIMQGTDPLATLIFAIFEKAFYWSLILFASKLIWQRVEPGSGSLHELKST